MMNKSGSFSLYAAGLMLLMLASFAAQAASADHAGARIFLTYCSGCHGVDGFAAYESAPSFSMGERLQLDDRELLQSVLNGKNEMPAWRDMLSVQDLRNAIAYIREMNERHAQGKSPRQEGLPDKYYMFRPAGKENMDWNTNGAGKQP